jgi:hypothetical protein
MIWTPAPEKPLAANGTNAPAGMGAPSSSTRPSRGHGRRRDHVDEVRIETGGRAKLVHVAEERAMRHLHHEGIRLLHQIEIRLLAYWVTWTGRLAVMRAETMTIWNDWPRLIVPTLKPLMKIGASLAAKPGKCPHANGSGAGR